MTEIIKRQTGTVRVDKVPSPNDLPQAIRPFIKLREPDSREYLWLCPLDTCRRTVRMVYRASDPLYCCMGGPKPHAKQMLICDGPMEIYQEMFYRFMGKGEQLGKPIIYPRNYYKFPVLARGEKMRDVAQIGERDA